MGVTVKDSATKFHGRSTRSPSLHGNKQSVVSRVKLLLRQGQSVYLCDVAGSYRLRVMGIRFSGKAQSLQVHTSFGWSTIWDTERLIDQHGDCLFESPAP